MKKFLMRATNFLALSLICLLTFSCSNKQKGEAQTNEAEASEIVEEAPSTGEINGHDWVNLGLPSGLKWATCNVGASKPEEYGEYFAWGQPEPMPHMDIDNELNNVENNTLKKDGVINDKGNLNPSYDAAHELWGGTWRLPTKEDVEELINNTTAEWTTLNGVDGYVVMSKINGNTIFLPATGYRNGAEVDEEGKQGDYWTSTPNGENPAYSYELRFSKDSFSLDLMSRPFGPAARAVSE